MPRPELLREHLVDEIVRRILDHLDLFEDDALLALDVGRRERRVHHHVAQQIDRERHVLVEHLDVVPGVFLGRERVELAANRIDRLRNHLRRARSVPLNNMCSTKCATPLSASDSCREPRFSHTPTLTERTCGIDSVMSRSPDGKVSETTTSDPREAARGRTRPLLVSHSLD